MRERERREGEKLVTTPLLSLTSFVSQSRSVQSKQRWISENRTYHSEMKHGGIVKMCSELENIVTKNVTVITS